MSIFKKVSPIVAAMRGSRPSRPLIPPKIRTWFSAAVGMTAKEEGAGHADGQATRPPMVAASFNSGDRQA